MKRQIKERRGYDEQRRGEERIQQTKERRQNDKLRRGEDMTNKSIVTTAFVAVSPVYFLKRVAINIRHCHASTVVAVR